MQKVSKYFKVLKKYFTSFYSAIAEVSSPISTAIAEPSYTSERFLISSGVPISLQEIKKIMDNQGKLLRRLDQRFDQLIKKIKGIDECLKEVEDM
ncbi:hypothetical protein F8M41_001553 [Gigaspora margarita]|uniref:Uncharacterized protein n=1 Tax=Gigaspora margarita TaxID=4874 RepID=A0A8H4ESP7_GIGMA|nr:hypothetical protein F8M41_001553 [Gigaspora margarita]